MAGSGKSSLCDQIERDSKSSVNTFKDATLTHDDRRRAGHGCLGEMVARLLGRSEDCVMDEGHLTDPGFRDLFKAFCDEFLDGVEKTWIFYSADTLSCVNNVFHDATTQGRVELSRYKALNNQRLVYQPPSEADWPGRELREVYRSEKPQFTNEHDAVGWLESEISRIQASL